MTKNFNDEELTFVKDFQDFKPAVFSTNFFLHRCQSLAETISVYIELKGEKHPMVLLLDNTLKLNREMYEIAKKAGL